MSELSPDYFNRPAGRGGPRDRGGPAARARAPAAHARDDRVGELRPPGGARLPGQRAHQQVRRGLSRPALLRRLRVRRHRRAARDRPRQGAVRGRARQRPAARRRAGQRGRLPRAAAARRHDHGPGAAPRRPPQPRDEAQRLRAACTTSRPTRSTARPASSTWTRSSASPTSASPSCCSRAGARTRASWTSSASARSPTTSAR